MEDSFHSIIIAVSALTLAYILHRRLLGLGINLIFASVACNMANSFLAINDVQWRWVLTPLTALLLGLGFILIFREGRKQ